ncbi:hypothetical protein JAAARDRAFT_63743 [Jaapia argillacea MUCL 33604]|uniref:Uncharacterized protein n=1 Tax=Jaapia argillacea MUCL 33604 TaxID=933084 RepID=A0A067P369_9AGAM|nr:hypothetical protein JAAARDRAFT_63743 [Jaapia argillacea MUCL 33604]
MDAVTVDPELASQMLQLLGQELLSLRKRQQDDAQRGGSQSQPIDFERIRRLEDHAQRLEEVNIHLTTRVADLSTENRRLKADSDLKSAPEEVDRKPDMEIMQLRRLLQERDNTIHEHSEQRTRLEEELNFLKVKDKGREQVILETRSSTARAHPTHHKNPLITANSWSSYPL